MDEFNTYMPGMIGALSFMLPFDDVDDQPKTFVTYSYSVIYK